MKIRHTIEIDAPDGATHYTGDLLDQPTWWKFSINSTGVCRHWCYFSLDREKGWMIHGENPPHFLQEIPRPAFPDLLQALKRAGLGIIPSGEAVHTEAHPLTELRDPFTLSGRPWGNPPAIELGRLLRAIMWDEHKRIATLSPVEVDARRYNALCDAITHDWCVYRPAPLGGVFQYDGKHRLDRALDKLPEEGK